MKSSAHESSRLRVVATLRAEHQELLNLLTCYAASPELQARRELLKSICAQTQLHYTAELGVFYCALEPLPMGNDIMNEGAEGYARAVALANELTSSGSDDRLIEQQIRELRDEILWHINSAEAANGPFALSCQVDVEWEVLERELSKRRQILSQRTLQGRQS
jgi:hypothetical protein